MSSLSCWLIIGISPPDPGTEAVPTALSELGPGDRSTDPPMLFAE
ncbi:hypothetical protein [Caballeronia sp. LZ043]|nr:hypothetical protein [Caballeronia sp. LZ043]MDR5822312.1 hypothetical protein [Caballeronia sp. LZ043]